MALPPPSVPQNNDGVVTGNDLAAAGGLYAIVPRYVTAGVGDFINLVFNGISVYQDVVFDIDREPPFPFIITSINVPNGNNTLFYTVTDTFNQTSQSPTVNVLVVGNDASPVPGNRLKMAVSTNAANYDYAAINVEPFNQGVLVGIPGSAVNVAVSEPALIYESRAPQHTLYLNEYGQAFFKVYSPRQGTVNITAYEPSRPDDAVHDNLIFGPYRIGNAYIDAINYSTYAPANGRTPNSIYLQTPTQIGGINITQISVAVSGHALIDGYNTQIATLLLNADNSAAIDIINTYVETVTVSLSLPQVGGGNFTLETFFDAQPVLD